MKVLFLDIDGVLNDHAKHANGYCGTKPECVAEMNRVLAATGCKIVISSAWRYMVLCGSMTLNGLEQLLLTHGLACNGRLIGFTRRDVSAEVSDRGAQIREWLMLHGSDVERYAVVDDLDLGISECGHPFVQTDGARGLTEADADRLIELLGRAS